MNHFTEALGLSRNTLYVQDYGGPEGFRMGLAHPERTESLIVQDAVAHNEGLGPDWNTRRAFWPDRAANESAFVQISSRSRPRGRGMSETIATSSATTRIFGLMNLLTQPARTGRHSKQPLLRLPNQRRGFPRWHAWMNGQVGPAQLEAARTGLDNPMSWDRVLEKFHSLSETFADEDLRNRLIETVQQLDTRPISDLMDLLAQVRPTVVFPKTHPGIQ